MTRNTRTVARLQVAMQRIAASRRQRCAYRGLPRIVSFEAARERLITTARAS